MSHPFDPPGSWFWVADGPRHTLHRPDGSVAWQQDGSTSCWTWRDRDGSTTACGVSLAKELAQVEWEQANSREAKASRPEEPPGLPRVRWAGCAGTFEWDDRRTGEDYTVSRVLTLRGHSEGRWDSAIVWVPLERAECPGRGTWLPTGEEVGLSDLYAVSQGWLPPEPDVLPEPPENSGLAWVRREGCWVLADMDGEGDTVWAPVGALGGVGTDGMYCHVTDIPDKVFSEYTLTPPHRGGYIPHTHTAPGGAHEQRHLRPGLQHRQDVGQEGHRQPGRPQDAVRGHGPHRQALPRRQGLPRVHRGPAPPGQRAPPAHARGRDQHRVAWDLHRHRRQHLRGRVHCGQRAGRLRVRGPPLRAGG